MRYVRRALVTLILLSCVAMTLAQQRGFQQPRDVIPDGSRVEYKTFHSDRLNRDIAYGLYLPPSYAKSPTAKYPVLYFMHGSNENEMRWSTRGGADLLLDKLVAENRIGEFIVAIPFAANSFYTNTRDGKGPWEDMIVQEFIPLIESTTRVNATRQTRGISGISMGGYGALKIAMKHPEMFGSVSAHSAALIPDLDNPPAIVAPRLALFKQIFEQIYGISTDKTYWDANNPLELAKDTKKLQGLKIYFDCGTEDDYGFFAGLKVLDDILTKQAYPHTSGLYPGNHGWDFGKQHIEQSMLFHWKAFSGK